MITLSKNDVKLIQELLDASRRRTGIRSRTQEDDWPSPDTYVVYASHDIPAATGSAGTGSGYDSTPGSAECNVFKLMSDGTLGSMGFTVTVYNVARTAISANRWLLATRDKLGDYYATASVDADSVSTLVESVVAAAIATARETEFTWTSTVTSNYAASIGEAVTCDVSAGGFSVTLPDWATSPINGKVLISTLACLPTPNRFASVVPTGTDKINGIVATTLVMADSGLLLVSASNVGGHWIFTRAGNSDVGWSSSRYLNT